MAWFGDEVVKVSYRARARIKTILRSMLPRRLWSVLRPAHPNQILPTRFERVLAQEWRFARTEHPWVASSGELPGGTNVIGFLRAAKGIAEAARSSTVALKSAEIPYTVVDFEFGIPGSQQVEALPVSQDGAGFKFNTNLMHINPPQLPYLWEAFRKEGLAGRYNIGVWYWELPEFPEEWRFAFDLVDEVWAGSQFIVGSVAAKSPVPVTRMPPCVDAVHDDRLSRRDYRLPDDRFLFLCAYDVLSIQARKNPLGAVQAFKRAFREDDASVGLVIKINNAPENADEIRRLRDELRSYSNCYIIEEVMDRSRMNSLMNLVDVYVSLHRSEGFGLIPAEAMSLGKPVIMTRWSGNLDLMTDDNSCGVDYRLIPVPENSGPYPPGQMWAEPDLDHAAFFMQKLCSDGQFYALISAHAGDFIRDHFSPRVIGARMRGRMQQVGLL